MLKKRVLAAPKMALDKTSTTRAAGHQSVTDWGGQMGTYGPSMGVRRGFRGGANGWKRPCTAAAVLIWLLPHLSSLPHLDFAMPPHKIVTGDVAKAWLSPGKSRRGCRKLRGYRALMDLGSGIRLEVGIHECGKPTS